MRWRTSLTALLGTAVALSLGVLGRGVAVWATPAPQAASLGDTPRGFWYGSDSYYPTVGGSAPYREPVLGGSYGGYMGMAGSWERWLGCASFLAWSRSDAVAANINRSGYGKGVGTGAYWFMGGPGVDPRYDGSAREARAWGSRQAARVLSDIRGLPAGQRVTYAVVWMDIELPKIAPAPDNGWTAVYTSPCSGAVRKHGITPSVNRAEVNGFSRYLRAHSRFLPGVYSSPGNWHKIFGTGADSVISRTYEWTYRPETADLRHAAAGWCLRVKGSRCARFFGGVNSASRYALMWQFSGGGGVLNGYGDFDQIDGRRMR
ncbi:MAG: hypothetical protein JO321_12885 [Solirubrobacterales bacterium]|nr:hypothetical protein [Solirubrobacterales bacterium]MBV9536298.1 hypothetical protein [Solirubrobacterales bacterium]